MGIPVDLARLEAFCDGTSEGLRAVIEIFLSDTSDTLTELNAAMARGEVSAVRLLAHRAGGSCAACGASALARILERLESTADVRGVVDESIAASQITAEFGAVTRFLHGYLEGRAI